MPRRPSAVLTPVPEVTEVRVNVAECAVLHDRGVLVTHGLGSCIALVLYDRTTHWGGLAHVLLPNDERTPPPARRPARCATDAVPHLVQALRRSGARGPLIAKIAGGASMFGTLLAAGGTNVGERNIDATRMALARAGIPIVGEDVGGDHGRSIFFNVATGALHVRSLKRGDLVL